MSKTNKLHVICYSVLGVALIVAIVFLSLSYSKNRRLKMDVGNNYNRAFYELTGYVNDIDAMLSKAQLASTPAQLASVSNEIFMQAAEAKSCFGQLPETNVNLEHTAKFLSQVGDYTYVLSQNMINGSEITAAQYSMLNKLNGYASELGKKLSDIQGRLYSGELNFETASNINSSNVFAASKSVFDDLEEVEKSFDGYPSLIYDGPFSEHIENMEAYMIKGKIKITEEEALEKAKEFLGDKGNGLESEGDTKNTSIESYIFGKDTDDGHISISITKQGGYVLYYLQNREVKENKYKIEQAISSAGDFLQSHGIYYMSSSYYETTDNVATINFAYTQDGIKCYSDLVKVRVALDNGEVCGIECKGYLMNHRLRVMPETMLTEKEARECVSTHLDVSAVSLAVVPKDSMREVVCYEYKGNYMGKNFIVYINAENGREEEILLLVESPSGVLTI